MNELAVIDQTPQNRAVRPIVPQNFEQVFRLADMIAHSGMAPKGIDTPEKIAVAVMHGLEIGFTPMAALQSIAVVNGRPSIWGDGALALVQGSGLMESFKEFFEGAGTDRKAVCIVKRRGDPEPKMGEFSVANAKTAGLWGKAGPWQGYPDRMLKMRARGFALRDGFADVLRGLAIAEEMQDVERVEATAALPPPPPPPDDDPKTITVSPSAPADAPPPPPPEAGGTESVGPDVAGVMAALRAAGSADELNFVWNNSVKPIWSELSRDQATTFKAAASEIKAKITAATAPAAPAPVEAIRTEFEAQAAKAPDFAVLDDAWNQLVNANLEAGVLSRADIEGVFSPIYDKHRERIEFAE